MVAIFVPPPILAEVEAVFDPPVIPHQREQVSGGHAAGVETADEVPHVVRDNLAAGRADLAVDAQRYAATGEAEGFAGRVGVVEMNPDAAGFLQSPLLPVECAAGGRCGAPAKHWTSASSTPG